MPRSAELTEHTEGWTAGLYLAAISAKASGAGVEGATGFRGDDHFLADYLRSELLSRLPRDELRFLTRTAVLERMTGPLCDAVLDASDSAAELAALERSNLFVVALDRNEQWYRYHHLFQELLRSELERGEPELVPQLLIVRRTGARRTGSRKPRSGTRRPPAMSTAWRAWWRAVLYRSTRAAAPRPSKRWLAWLADHWGT